VTVLEAGKAFKPFGMELEGLEKLRRLGLFFDHHEIQFVIPAFKTRRAKDEMILVNGSGLGGTTTISTGNALRLDEDLKALGIDLDSEFEEVFREVPVTTAHQKKWHKVTRRLFAIFELGRSRSRCQDEITSAACCGCRWDAPTGQGDSHGSEVAQRKGRR
jgi:hypothetical protein